MNRLMLAVHEFVRENCGCESCKMNEKTSSYQNALFLSEWKDSHTTGSSGLRHMIYALSTLEDGLRIERDCIVPIEPEGDGEPAMTDGR